MFLMYSYVALIRPILIRLAFKLNDGKVIAAEVAKDTFTIGRSSKCDVVIPSEGLSREHCSIQIEDGDIFITDFGSANGVLIDDERIPANQKVQYNSSFSLSLGSIEVTKFLVETPQDLMELDYGDRSESATGSSNQASARVSSSSTRSPRLRGESKTPSSAAIHPGLKGMIFIGIFAVVYFFYTQIFDGSSASEEPSLRQQTSSPNKKWTDGSIPTKNF